MTEQLTELDRLVLARWTDAVGLRTALSELEERLTDRLRIVAERLSPWLESKGFVSRGVEGKYACINVGRQSWIKSDDSDRIYISIAALYPFGFRRNEEEHPYVWVYAYGLSKDEQQSFSDAIRKRLEGKPGGWINDGCDKKAPVGRYIESYGDPERIELALSEEKLEAFVKEQLEPILALAGDLDAALSEV